MKLGFIFAGQGQQFLSMGEDLYNDYPSVKSLYDRANKILGYNLLDLTLEQLNQTIYTQPALYTLNCALDLVLKENQVYPDVVSGLSLGEYSALVSSEVISFEAGLKIIAKRAKLMSEAFLPKETGMAATLRVNQETIEALLKDSEIEICNINSPSQIIIGGKMDQLEKTLEYLKSNKVRSILLNVSTVSHMSLLKGESEKLKIVLDNFQFSKPKIKFINNVEAKVQEDNFKESLSRQISEKTLLAKSIQKMLDLGVSEIIEVGPKNTIVKFVKEIDKNIKTFNVYDVLSLKEYLDGKKDRSS